MEYFDFYLLHNVYENSYGVYTDPKWGILDYFAEQVRLGRIRHLGFSSHARPDTLEKFLEYDEAQHIIKAPKRHTPAKASAASSRHAGQTARPKMIP